MRGRARVLRWSGDEILEFLRADFPQAFRDGWDYEITDLAADRVTVRLSSHESQLRPGGTISGPTMMHLADFAVYVLLLALHGQSASLSVTTNLTISFLRKPEAGDLIAEVELLKHGRTLSVAAVHLRDERGRVVAHAEATYHMAGAD